jgi:hypothetical protein
MRVCKNKKCDKLEQRLYWKSRNDRLEKREERMREEREERKLDVPQPQCAGDVARQRLNEVQLQGEMGVRPAPLSPGKRLPPAPVVR